MRVREPELFKSWSAYMKQRQAMISAVVFKNHDWYEWEEGHAKLFGILLWYYETKKQTMFKYSRILKKAGYRRTHNYRLLKKIVENKVLCKKGNGVYTFSLSDIHMIDKVLLLVKEVDMVQRKV